MYSGVAFADPAMWPADGGGILSDFGRYLPLLRNGIPAAALADIGRRLAGSS
ncbi:hypothetical protein [Nocardia wallacei]|uniref:hypothetical protein n=1 Tax=Nocardia wallacei TaxID=480035 RepID=UPI0024586F4D|nr:hypothetical protein [Nocardia wallacei]